MTDGGAPNPAWRRRPGDPVAVLGHRGGTGPWRENTLEAFAGARRAGADGVELDVRRTSDGALVLHHDPEVPGLGPVAERRADQMPPWMPTLVQALRGCAGAAVDVEIKNLPFEPGYDPDHRVATEVADVLRREAAEDGPWPARVVVSSFWAETLAVFGAADRAAGHRGGAVAPALGLLVHPALDVAAALDTAVGLGCAAVHPHHSQVDAALVDRAHDLGMAVVTWTVNLPLELDAVVRAGVDAVVTDDVAGTLARLGRG